MDLLAGMQRSSAVIEASGFIHYVALTAGLKIVPRIAMLHIFPDFGFKIENFKSSKCAYKIKLQGKHAQLAQKMTRTRSGAPG